MTSPTTIALHVLFAPLYVAAVLPEVAAILVLLALWSIVAAASRQLSTQKGTECNTSS